MFCLLALSAKFTQAQLSMSVHVRWVKWATFAQDVVIWVRPDWNDKPPSSRIVSALCGPADLLLALPWLSSALV